MAQAASDPVPPLWQRLSVRHLFLLTPWVGVVIGASRPIRDNSFLWHVRAGELQLQAGEVLRSDPFTFTMQGEAWRTQSWLADLLYGALEQATGGLSWVPWLLILCGGLVVALVGLAAFRRVSDLLPVAMTLVALVWLGLPNLVPRPVIFSFVLLALLVVVLEIEADWPVPLILWVWASLHGSFVLGLGLLVLDALRRRMLWRRAVARLGVAVVAVSVTAHGLGVWSMLRSFATNRGALAFISEWAPPDLLSIASFPYLLVIAAVMVAAASGRLGIRDLWVVVPFLVFGLTSQRAIMPAVIVVLPYAASAWPEKAAAAAELKPNLARINVAIAGLLLLAPFAGILGFQGIDDERFPVEASRYLEGENVWHDDATGGYLIYAGRVPVFIDDRAELFGEDFFREFVETRRGAPAWRAAFDNYGIDEALVGSESGLAQVLTVEGWQVQFTDDRWTVYSSP